MNELINDIKKELRANMNGVASAHARQTEDYRVNWGIELPRVKNIADEIAENCAQKNISTRELAQALWKESTRECKILACMLMPSDEIDEEVCEIWMENIRTEEIATMFCLYLVQRLPYASTKAYEWMAHEKSIPQTCGFLTLCHLMRKYELSPDAQEEFLDQAAASLDNKYAIKALQIYASQGKENARKVKKVADYL
jgi:3-methyladenine DNA glycosylase AlkD